MRIALVGPELEENLGLRYLHAALVRAGHQALIFSFSSASETGAIARRLLGYAPHIVGLSMVFTGRAREFAALAERLRTIGYCGHITAGGHFASFHAEQLLADVPAIDSVVHGEGEGAITDLANRLCDPSTVPGMNYRKADGTVAYSGERKACVELDSLPWPTRTPPFHTYLGVPIANILSSRGCFGRCNFCSISAWYKKTGGPRFRQRAPDQVAREMASLYHQHGVRIFNFHDDNFFLPSPRENLQRFSLLKSALDRAGVGPIAIQVKARPDSISRATVDSLRELGLFRVFLGVESNAVAGLRTLGRGIRREQNHKALRVLEAAGVHTSFNLLMFDPETTLHDLDDNIRFLEEYARFPLNFGRVEVYAGTPLETRLRAEKRLLGGYWGHSYVIRDSRVECAFQLFKSVFNPRNFEDGAVNLLAMKVDYLLHVLTYFHSQAATKELADKCRSSIEELNGHSVKLLKTVRHIVSGESLPGEQEQIALTQALREERESFDKRIRRQMQCHIRTIQQRALADKQWTIPVQAAAAAVVAAMISVSGCRAGDRDRHMTEMMMRPIEEPQKPALPPETPKPRVEANTNKPTVKQPEDWHMCEMMMMPMEPNRDSTAAKAE